jgi:selenocysteine lyase/cysteine desulfurase
MASGIVSVSLKGASAREVAGSLKQQDIVVKVIPVAEYNGLRFSTDVYNSETEIERLVGGLAEHLGAG